MRVSTIFSFVFIGTAFAAPSFDKRDLAAFQSAFGAISSATQTFDTAVKALSSSSGVEDAKADLTAKSNAIVDAVNSGTTTVNAQPALSLGDSVSLLSLSNTLVGNVNTTINDLTSKKSFIDAANEDAFVVSQLQSVKSASQTFIAAVVSKVPSSVQNIANTQAQQVITVLNTGITTFGGSVKKAGTA